MKDVVSRSFQSRDFIFGSTALIYPRWPKLTQVDPSWPKWPKLTQVDSSWPKLNSVDLSLPKLIHIGPSWLKLTQIDLNWPKLIASKLQPDCIQTASRTHPDRIRIAPRQDQCIQKQCNGLVYLKQLLTDRLRLIIEQCKHPKLYIGWDCTLYLIYLSCYWFQEHCYSGANNI